MSLNVRAGGGGGLGLSGRLFENPAGVVGWLPEREAPRRRGAQGRGARGTPLQTLRRAGGGLTARTGPAGKGAAADNRRREPEGDRARRAPFCSGELF